MKLTIIPDKILREIAKPVSFPLSAEIKKIIKSMMNHIDSSQLSYSRKKAGIGLAAPQIGHSLQMFYVNVPKLNDLPNMKHFLINPEIIAESESWAALEGGEGCLSVPEEVKETSGLVHRRFKVVIKGYDFLAGKEVTLTKTGYHAIVLQHEYDHLQGKLFFDRIDKDNWKTKKNEVLI